ncbi:error-prone DNA polymerase [Cupriavidus oxalaticus]|jgi:error-prone DNA polymerase|uniref:Error-prone DNA polymerase n=1 Tax=Cupriavidus oxalaticus TaxID=96344 RepID=A0A375FNZ2_9BURK|nr:error-prone DNA polymerase [Cupriavidus oxalaticus]QRQ83717.1 error-prone DNA polymerase [Cupriavidus oxalaticus]QRQ92194.1 error-prone DNA polymerase [Cupriavidus oxalaticus]WQD86803.1 error-prone DNA polymerase [Cupriavidus oxalaticus]SPC05500.1 Error-prone DNA polymerase [Cupriavidus oxalaticus]SPC19138.1 Error-prone DNA polymerase [Cupriavidus oxalaticus]
MTPVIPSLPGLLPALPDYVELHCISNFTFLTGASHPGELIERAFGLGYRGLALTDECSVAGTARAHDAIQTLRKRLHDAVARSAARGAEADIDEPLLDPEVDAEPDGDDPAAHASRHQRLQALAAAADNFALLIGSRFSLPPAEGTDRTDHTERPPLRLVLIAQHRDGFGNLSELITLGRRRAQKGSYRLHPEDIAAPGGGEAHLRGMPGCLALLLPDYCADPELLREQAQWCRDVFGERAWIALELLQGHADGLHRARLEAVSAQTGVPLAAAGAVTMHVRSRKPLSDVMTAIRLGQPLAECGMALAPNAEQHLRMRQVLSRLYPRDALAQTLKIAAQCDFSLGMLRYEYPEELVPQGFTPISYLREEVRRGKAERFPNGLKPEWEKQLEEELQLIEEKQYEPFFLTVHDIVRFARANGILCQGRGSAANSLVCFCLYVTEVSPEQANLLFGRFLSRERDEPPDIDVDFEHQRREEVIQYIYQKYGRHRAALAASLITYRSRSALRDVGRALGIDASVVEQVVKGQAWWDGPGFMERIARYGLDPHSPAVQQWASLTAQLRGFPRHLSQHVGGFVIARDKLSRLVPIENAAMADRSVIQWDKDDLESLGLLKVDVLALGMLSAIRRALEMIPNPDKTRVGLPARMEDIPKEDPETYDMICKADTIGVFQIESRAQQSMLPRLQPRKYYDLVVEVAIVRPGPIQGGMVHPYLKRREAFRLTKKPPVYFNAVIEKVLGRTLGVPIFQEQVMQLAIDAAGFSPGQADQLRRSMAAWRRRGDLRQHQDALVRALTGNGYPESFALAICKQIEGFGEYGFPESHAASFAKLVYVSSWLKCHHPAAFLCALLNSQPMGFYSPSQLVQDAQRHDVVVLPVDVTLSRWESTLEQVGADAPPRVRLGLSRVKGMRKEAALRIEGARVQRAFDSVEDLALRAALDRHDIDALAASDALAPLAGHRRQARWQARAAAGHAAHRDLLYEAPPAEDALMLPAPRLGEDVTADYASLGLSLKSHPLALLRDRLKAMRFATASQLQRCGNGRRVRACGIVTVRQRPATASGTIFATIEDETGTVNLILWPDLVERQRKEVLGATLLGVVGIWQRQGDVRHLVAKELVDLSPLLGRLMVGSRDFH